MVAQRTHTKSETLKMRRELSLLFIFIALIVYFLWMDPLDLPDFDAYERIYQSSLLGGHWEILFVFMNFFFRQNGFSYADFRDFILIFSLSGLWFAFQRLKPAVGIKSNTLRIVNILILYFILTFFIFEYFVIRIRAGLAIGMIFWAIYFYNSSQKSVKWFGSSIFFSLAFFTHQSTTTVLFILLGLPLITSTSKINQKLKNRLYFLTTILSVFILLYVAEDSFADRGEYMFSPLNPVRFIMLALVPLFIFFTSKNETNLASINGNTIQDFPIYFVKLYSVLATALVFMYFTGLTDESGEAIVRLYTLSSIPALLSLRLWGSFFKARISTYILIINCLFFVVTVFMPK